MKGLAGTVADAEQIYRRVRETVGVQVCFQYEAGRVKFKHGAFNDRGQRPSMDRANLAQHDPHRTRMGAEDGVIAFRADAIRRIGPIPRFNEKNKRLPDDHGVNVISDPMIGNCAHALVVVTPPSVQASGGTFKKLKEGLVRLADEAGWSVEPQSPLPRRTLWSRILDALRCLRLRLTRAL